MNALMASEVNAFLDQQYGLPHFTVCNFLRLISFKEVEEVVVVHTWLQELYRQMEVVSK
jgi:hypothetical protein